MRAYSGSSGFDEARFRAIATTEFAPSRNIESALTLRRVDGVGLEALPSQVWDVVVAVLADHIRRNRETPPLRTMDSDA